MFGCTGSAKRDCPAFQWRAHGSYLECGNLQSSAVDRCNSIQVLGGLHAIQKGTGTGGVNHMAGVPPTGFYHGGRAHYFGMPALSLMRRMSILVRWLATTPGNSCNRRSRSARRCSRRASSQAGRSVMTGRGGGMVAVAVAAHTTAPGAFSFLAFRISCQSS